MTEWLQYNIADLIADEKLFIGDGYRAKNEELSNRGLPFARVGNINGGFQFDEADHFPEDSLTKVGNKISVPWDVVFTSKGTVGRFALVRPGTPRFVYSPQLCFWRSLDEDFIYPRFLYYWMSSREFFVQFKGVAAQTDMAEYVSLTDQRRMHITLPQPSEQRTIAHILGTLDDKIELNRKMNQTLEAMARAIFKSWFVNFDPVRAKAEGRDSGLPPDLAALFPDSFEDSELGEIPKGWRVAELEEIADVVDCLHSKKPDRRDNGQPLLQLWNIRDDGLIDMTDTYFIGTEDYKKWISRMEALPGDCVITNVGRVGAVAQMPKELKAALGRNMTGIRCKAKYPYPTFLIECLLSEAMRSEIINKKDTGTILDALNVRNIPKLRFIMPYAELLKKFEDCAKPIRARMERNLTQSKVLATLRDELLPKLLSGKIRVTDAVRFAEVPATKNEDAIKTATPSKRKATDEFREAILISALVRALSKDGYLLGRKRYTKICYLIHRKLEHAVEQKYLKKAAGPYSPWTKYKGPERIAINNCYIKESQKGVLTGFSVGPEISKIDQYLPRYDFNSVFGWAVNNFGKLKNDRLELLATVDFATLELKAKGKLVNVKNVRELMAAEPEWTAKLDRAIFSEINIQSALRALSGYFPEKEKVTAHKNA